MRINEEFWQAEKGTSVDINASTASRIPITLMLQTECVPQQQMFGVLMTFGLVLEVGLSVQLLGKAV